MKGESAQSTPSAQVAQQQAKTHLTPRNAEETRRPPQQEELLCTICHLPSCSR
jgi:hypothetical protein